MEHAKINNSTMESLEPKQAFDGRAKPKARKSRILNGGRDASEPAKAKTASRKPHKSVASQNGETITSTGKVRQAKRENIAAKWRWPRTMIASARK